MKIIDEQKIIQCPTCKCRLEYKAKDISIDIFNCKHGMYRRAYIKCMVCFSKIQLGVTNESKRTN